ncbi:MAG: hypothetical protein DRI90_08755 [Deltaproteobacteria bacterium]|nr:MAG: hypothetical protein DRI90_08755 [Deltaproteobacteria bacterium]
MPALLSWAELPVAASSSGSGVASHWAPLGKESATLDESPALDGKEGGVSSASNKPPAPTLASVGALWGRACPARALTSGGGSGMVRDGKLTGEIAASAVAISRAEANRSVGLGAKARAKNASTSTGR